MILALVNTLAILGALGMAVYTKMLFKRPPITEEGERAKLQEKKNKPAVATQRGTIEIPSLTFNIASSKATAGRSKLHYGSAAITIEIANIDEQADFDAIKPVFMDKMLQLFGKKTFDELTTVQGRYVLRMELLEMINALMKRNYVTNIFFTKFIIQ